MLTDWNIAFWEYEFLAPQSLWLLLAVPFLLIWLFYRARTRKGDLKFSRTVSEQQHLGSNWIKYTQWAISGGYGLILSLLILALAKPFNWSSDADFDQDYKDGIDIIITMDLSGSMLARDFLPNRLEASKKVAKEFIDSRHGDRIGLVAYAGEAYTACPATLDYEIVKAQIDHLESGFLAPGTAIGIGLGTAVTRLRNDSLPSKVIILLTDGINTSEEITPAAAAALAKAKNVRVYTIGVGSMGIAPFPVFTPFGVRYEDQPVEIDEVTLTQIALETGGKYFRAKDEDALRSIYAEIDQLEKRQIKQTDYKSEPPTSPMPFLNWALVLMLLIWSVQLLFFKTNG
jgi:Ca-activated chloride channel family protein